MVTSISPSCEVVIIILLHCSCFQALEEIEDALKSKPTESKLRELTSKFYTIIPHDFGRKVPPVIRDPETLQKKFDMLLVS